MTLKEQSNQLYREGKSIKDIAKIINRNHSLVAKWARKAGLKRTKEEQIALNVLKQTGKLSPFAGVAPALRLAFRDEQSAFKNGDEVTHWGNHPEVGKAKALAYYYRNHEAGKARSRANAKRIYKERRNDPAFKAKRRASTNAWISLNRDRAREGKRKSHKAWRVRPENRAAISQRKRFKEIMQTKNPLRTVEMIGCSVQFLKQWLESKWRRGMSWGNYGSHWCIDHVIPCAKFDLRDKEQIKRCFHYSNLQPLTNYENTAKCDRIKPTQPELCIAI